MGIVFFKVYAGFQVLNLHLFIENCQGKLRYKNKPLIKGSLFKGEYLKSNFLY